MLWKIFSVALVGGILLTSFILYQKHSLSLFKFQPTLEQTATPSAYINEVTNSPLPKVKQNPSQKPQTTPTSSPKIKINTDASGETTVEISEDVLNNQIKSSLIGQSLGTTPLGDAIITDANIRINNDYMLISGIAKNGFITLPFQIKATLELKDGQPKLNLSDLSLNNIPLPQIVADQLTNIIQGKLNEIINSYNFKLKSIALVTSKIVIVGEK